MEWDPLRNARHIRLSQDFHFGILSHSSTHPAGSFATAVLHSRRQRAIWQLGVRLRDGVNRHFDPFPMRFLGHLAIPSACFPRFPPAGLRSASLICLGSVCVAVARRAGVFARADSACLMESVCPRLGPAHFRLQGCFARHIHRAGGNSYGTGLKHSHNNAGCRVIATSLWTG